MNPNHHPWSINLQAKSKSFNFKFKATRFLPACYNFFQFTIFLKVYSLVIRVSSDNNINQPARRKSFKSKIKRFVERFRSLPMKRKTGSVQKVSGIEKLKSVSCEGPICGGTVVIGNLAMLIQSIYYNDVKGIIVHCFSLLLYILTLLKTFMRIKNNKLIIISVLLMVGYPLWLYMMNNYSILGRIMFSWRCIGKIWRWVKAAANLGLFG